VLGCGASKSPTRSQLLAKSLKKCRKQFKHAKQKRGACERKARKRYGGKRRGKSARTPSKRK
ncbi:MAG TPA: hypothetical protein VLJ80_12020, partial [Solirubrobacteraceae bacterium]|nr:hypothetical protein [Solirubrobacteraceae bacterium]